jgi:2-polyprenyl-6-hydroxyphenyl methylase / 3-demethylubiquinone-9 3-methyltransferase
MTNIAGESDRYNRLRASWWSGTGSLRPLHRDNALRLDHGRNPPAAQLVRAGLRTLNVDCGAALRCNPLARLGGRVSGIDAAAGSTLT